jgi:DMSO/TMAO reductase YedYZ molybdopterin-dependent catalytic subunit
MKTKRAITGATLGLVLGIPWLAFSYAGQQLAKLPLIPIDLFEWITRVLPGGLVTVGLEVMIQTLHRLNLGSTSVLGKALEFAMAYMITLAGFILAGALFALAFGDTDLRWQWRGIIVGISIWIAAVLLAAWGGWGSPGPIIGGTWLLAICFAWGLALAWGVDTYLKTLELAQDASRQRTIAGLIASSLVISGLAVLLPRWLPQTEEEEGVADLVTETRTPIPTEPVEAVETASPTQTGFRLVEGTRPEITPIDDFYRVDINLLPPGQEDFQEETDNLAQRLRAQGELDMPAESYLLVIDGLVENPQALDLNTIRSLPMASQNATLECISNPVGGDLISTTLFRGARLKDVLARAELKPEAVDIKFTCVDGYTESLPLESVNDSRTLLCYAMGDQALTESHGAPLRLYTPDRFGMKCPKWIIKIEAVGSDFFGYWEKRGWSEQAWVQTTSVIDTINKIALDQVEIGGIAFAGARGIQKIELRIDEGDWEPALIKDPLSSLTWVLWRARLSISAGRHAIAVRTTDGTGEIQTARESSTYPDGATGYHQMTVNIS